MNNIAEEKPSAKDPSMAQILQTIRGVITEDKDTVLQAEPEDILELDPSLEVKEAKSEPAVLHPPVKSTDLLNNIDNALGNSELELAAQIPPKIEPEVLSMAAEMAQQQAETSSSTTIKASQLLSEQTARVTSESLKALMKSVAKPASDGLAFRGGTTVEDLVTELMKPYLKEWLDKNLPTIVKQIVEKEIHKLIPQEED